MLKKSLSRYSKISAEQQRLEGEKTCCHSKWTRARLFTQQKEKICFFVYMEFYVTEDFEDRKTCSTKKNAVFSKKIDNKPCFTN